MSDAFQRRLDEVNQELADTLKRNEEQRHHLLQSTKNLGGNSYRGLGPYTDLHGSGVGGAGLNSYAPHIMTNSDLVAKEISIAVAREMKVFDHKVSEMVEREWEIRVQALDQTLRSRFTEMQTMHEKMTSVLLDTSKGLEKHKKYAQQQHEDLERYLEDSLDDFKKDLKGTIHDIHREVRSLKDQVNEAQIDGRADAKEVNRRVDDLQRRLAGIQQEAEAVVDSRMVSVRQELVERTKTDMRRQEDDLEELRRSVVALKGTVEAAEGKITKLSEEVDIASDNTVTQSSQIRNLRSDLAQLELLTNKRSERGAPAEGSSGGSGGSGGQQEKVQNDIFSLKQSVAYLASVLESNGMISGAGGVSNVSRSPTKTAAAGVASSRGGAATTAVPSSRYDENSSDEVPSSPPKKSYYTTTTTYGGRSAVAEDSPLGRKDSNGYGDSFQDADDY